MYLIEWAIDLGCQVMLIIHKSFESLTLSLINYINEPSSKKTKK